LRYPSDLTDEEWSLIEALIPPAKRGGRKQEVVLREVVNGMMYVLSRQGVYSRALPAAHRSDLSLKLQSLTANY
jgi:transposase